MDGNKNEGCVGGDRDVSEGPKSEIFVELVQVHECLRNEVNSLADRAKELHDCVGGRRSAVECSRCFSDFAKQFDYFFVVYHSHSRAEDEIIFPALEERGVLFSAHKELSNEHEGQQQAFALIRSMVLHLTSQTSWENVQEVVDRLVMLVDRLKATVFLHFRKEEEEVLPLLCNTFQGEELSDLVGQVIGERPCELIVQYINMISRGLDAKERDIAIKHIQNAAKGTKFSTWLTARQRLSERAYSNQNDIDVSGGGLQVSFVPRNDGPGQMDNVLGCKHYRRNCKVLANCCKKMYTCRLCHDEDISNQVSMGLLTIDKMHSLDRYKINTMWCMLCGQVQPVNKTCNKCGATMSRYYCNVCNLFDDNPLHNIYHCPFCNVCRTGRNLGLDFFHCMKCNACISTKHRKHKCMERSLESDCPICCDDLFNSTKPIKELRCGHFMHRDCYSQYTKQDFRCPVCRKSVLKGVEQYWKQYQQAIETYIACLKSENRAPNYVRDVVHCNDCDTTMLNEHVEMLEYPYSTIPPRCSVCGSFNTLIQQ